MSASPIVAGVVSVWLVGFALGMPEGCSLQCRLHASSPAAPDAALPTCESLGAPPTLFCNEQCRCDYDGSACVRAVCTAP